MIKKIAISIALAFTFNISVNAQEKMNLDNLLKLGLENNLKIKSFKNKKDIFLSQVISANSINNPIFNIDASPPENTYKFGISQEIEFAYKRKIKTNEANKNKELYELELNKLTNEVKFDIKSKYNEISYLNLKVNKYDELLKTFSNLIKISKKREKIGDIPNIDVSQLELMYLDILNEKQDILNTLNQEKINISELIGIENYSIDTNDKEYLSIKNIDIIDLDNIYKKNIDIYYFNKLKEYYSIQKEKIEAENNTNINLSGGFNLITDPKEPNFGMFIGVSKEIPIFYKREGEIKEVEAKIFQLNSEIDTMKQSIKVKINSYIERLKFQKNKIDLYKTEILPKSLELLNKSNTAFEFGKYNVINSISFHQSYIENELKYIDTVYEYKKNLINLEREVYNEII